MRQVSNLLEVIVTSLHEAVEAERGGADRLELVRALDEEGLTPSLELVKNVVRTVTIPVRVILREAVGFTLHSAHEIRELRNQAALLAELPIDGLVAGFIKEGRVDVEGMQEVLSAAPKQHVTFHRAFDSVHDPLAALQQMKLIPQVDRILTDGGHGAWAERKARLLSWQQAADCPMKILVGGGLDAQSLAYLVGEPAGEPALTEFHVGRAVRIPATHSGAVRRSRVSELKSILS
jgi:copper homeostasis protein